MFYESFLTMIQIMQKVRIVNFSYIFRQRLYNFRATSLQKMVLKTQQGQSLYPVGIFEDIASSFCWNWTQRTPKYMKQQIRTFFTSYSQFLSKPRKFSINETSIDPSVETIGYSKPNLVKKGWNSSRLQQTCQNFQIFPSFDIITENLLQLENP